MGEIAGISDGVLVEEMRKARRNRRVALALQGACIAALVGAMLVPPGFSHAMLAIATGMCGTLLVMTFVLARLAISHLRQQIIGFQDSRSSRHQVEELFAMTDMLQAAEGYDDAGAVLKATSQRLLPDFGGALYILNNSRDRLDLAASWNTLEDFHHPEALVPSSCWALKRGKPHINDPASRTLCCAHHRHDAVGAVEVPMTARGEIHGLLVFTFNGEHSFEHMMDVRRPARALADSMSLALSNIALREKLRTQSLRDPLTGLYNRRYMEDALERYFSLAERTGGATSIVMIDLDNFKHLNDEHGHAKGDAVLRDVAAQLVSALRPSDVVARYGGEELLVILPNCGLNEAVNKAESLRIRVEALSEAHGTAITASFGVASVPETSATAADVIPMADSALYAAKQGGKNRVRAAERRSERADAEQPRLAAG